MMNIVILGATKGMGRALARQLAARGDALLLLGRAQDQLERSARDLEVRSHQAEGCVHTAHCDLAKPEDFASIIATCTQTFERIDAVVITAGMFDNQGTLAADPEAARRLLTVNFANTVTLCEYFRAPLLAQGGGTLCVFSSVAGDRGRKPVVLYGASKAGLSHYLESLDHSYRAQGLHTLCVKPGFVKTSMTDGLKPPPFAGEPEKVAAQVIRAIDKKRPLLYTPSAWRFVMLVIKHLPRFVMRRINF